MTRLRFLLVSLLASACAALGLSRERLARAWLKQNGFELWFRDRMVKGTRHYFVICYHGKLPGSTSAHQIDSLEPPVNPASSFIDWFSRRDFTIVQKPDPWFPNEPENQYPPITHRFPRPWWA